MKKKILLLTLTAGLLALTASLASAVPGLDAAWNGCPLVLTNPTDITDPCNDSGAAPKKFWLSFSAPAGITKFVGEEFIIDVQTDAPILPDWWHLEVANASTGTPAGCRAGEFGFDAGRDFASTITCKDYWGTSSLGGTVWLPGKNGPQHTRMFGAFARSTSSAIAITADIEYYVGRGFFTLNHADLDLTTTPCTGCLLGACLVFQYLKVAQPAGTPGGDALIENGNQRRYLTWQGISLNPSPGCPASTPTRKATWGQVKSMYR